MLFQLPCAYDVKISSESTSLVLLFVVVEQGYQAAVVPEQMNVGGTRKELDVCDFFTFFSGSGESSPGPEREREDNLWLHSAAHGGTSRSWRHGPFVPGARRPCQHAEPQKPHASPHLRLSAETAGGFSFTVYDQITKGILFSIN